MDRLAEADALRARIRELEVSLKAARESAERAWALSAATSRRPRDEYRR